MKIQRHLLFLPLCLLFLSDCKKHQDPVETVYTPVVTTAAVTDITNTTAKSGGNVTDAGSGNIVAKGICWSVNQFPTIASNDKTVDGTGLGQFKSVLSNLKANKTYYVRAYATNEQGTGYGDNIKFTTSALPSFSYNSQLVFVFPSDNGLFLWGPDTIITGATSITDGEANTQAISGFAGSYAAKVCADLDTLGYDDWYLPSEDELNTMYQFKTIIGGLSNADYWSSTEHSAGTATAENLQNGIKLTNALKSQPKLCRCVRKD